MALLRILLIAAVGLLPAGGLAADPGGRASPAARTKGSAKDAKRSQKLDQIIGRLDANRNGTIEPGEVIGRRRLFFEQMARRAGLDPNKPIPVSKMKEALSKLSDQSAAAGKPGAASSGKPGAASSGKPGTGAKPGSSEKKTGSKTASAPQVSGFGVESKQPEVAGFGPSAGGGESAGRSTGFSSGSSGSRGDKSKSKKMEAQVRSYAKSLMKRYDKNKNGRLEKDEWKDIKGTAATSDANRDGIITLDELHRRLMNYSSKDSSGKVSSGSSSSSRGKSRSRSYPKSSSSSAGSSDPKSRKTYRVLTPTERLPEGLPDWFARQDANGDGQVTMAEYSSTWTDSKAAEFTRLDPNGDGVITPTECLASEKPAE